MYEGKVIDFSSYAQDEKQVREGMFRKEPQAVTQHCEGLVLQCAALGAQILDNAAACLAPGGTLVYSTCTFAPQEDEMQIGAFLARHPEFELLPLPEELPEGEYTVHLGLYRAEGRLPVTRAGAPAGDAVELGTVTVRCCPARLP